MATLRESVFIQAAPEAIWDAARDVAALHTRLVPGFVVDTKLEGAVRVVTFANGMTAREPIVSVDDERRRLAWGAVGGRTTHYNAVLEVGAHHNGSVVTWTIDLLPDELASPINAMQRQGLAAMKKAFEG